MRLWIEKKACLFERPLSDQVKYFATHPVPAADAGGDHQSTFAPSFASPV
jgi:hypothetical protein